MDDVALLDTVNILAREKLSQSTIATQNLISRLSEVHRESFIFTNRKTKQSKLIKAMSMKFNCLCKLLNQKLRTGSPC